MTLETKPVVVRETDRPRDGWDDPVRGTLSWATFFSSDITPTSGMSAGVAEIPPGAALNVHRHEQPEIYLIVEGSGVLTIEGVETPVAAGTAVFIPGNASHGLRNGSAAKLRLFYVFPTDSFAEVVYRFPE